MTDKPAPDDRYHPQRIQYAGSAPRGWDDDYRFTAYVRADIHDEVMKALQECADDLEAYVKDEYVWPHVHPAMQGKFDRDMEPVRAARAALAKIGEAG